MKKIKNNNIILFKSRLVERSRMHKFNFVSKMKISLAIYLMIKNDAL